MVEIFQLSFEFLSFHSFPIRFWWCCWFFVDSPAPSFIFQPPSSVTSCLSLCCPAAYKHRVALHKADGLYALTPFVPHIWLSFGQQPDPSFLLYWLTLSQTNQRSACVDSPFDFMLCFMCLFNVFCTAGQYHPIGFLLFSALWYIGSIQRCSGTYHPKPVGMVSASVLSLCMVDLLLFWKTFAHLYAKKSSRHIRDGVSDHNEMT